MLMIMMMIALMMIMLCCVSQKTTAPKQMPFSEPNLAAKGEGAPVGAGVGLQVLGPLLEPKSGPQGLAWNCMLHETYRKP
jgi:hypothetical protein